MVQRAIAQNALALANSSLGRGVGDLWNTPNEAIGLTYGYLGDAVGRVGHAFAPDRVRMPEIRPDHGQREFINNPFGTGGAITIGANTVYGDDPYSAVDRDGPGGWAGWEAAEGHPVLEHEKQQAIQGRQLGPAYLPSNLLGGLHSRLHGESWHGDHNWNERGPQSNPARPWAPKP